MTEANSIEPETPDVAVAINELENVVETIETTTAQTEATTTPQSLWFVKILRPKMCHRL